jgi:hypothetical protein
MSALPPWRLAPEHPSPLPGDILFFESGKAHAKAIAGTQKRMGLKHYKFIHAALVVDGDMIVESTTLYGVRKVRLSELRKRGVDTYLGTTVLRKPRTAPPRPQGQATRLADAAYYYFKQSYGWRDLVARDLESDEKSICSAFVKRVLLRMKAVPTETFDRYRKQIFPAELFEALTMAGYRELKYDQRTFKPLQLGSLDIFDIMETFREIDDRIEKTSLEIRRSGLSELLYLERKLCQESPNLWRVVSLSGKVDVTFLDFVHQVFFAVCSNWTSINHQITRGPVSWRDQSKSRNIWLRVSETLEYSRCAMNMASTFIDMLHNQPIFSKLEEETIDDRFNKLIDGYRDLVHDLFLFTGATDLDQLDTKIKEGRLKVEHYKIEIAACQIIAELDVPSLEDYYKMLIEELERCVSMLRGLESRLGRSITNQIIDAAWQIAHGQRH